MDRFLSTADAVLRTLYAKHHSATPHPARAEDRSPERPEDKALSAALMRVNHVGEVCAQALYTAQAASTRNPALKAHFERAAHEETDHLAWTRQRLDELGDRVSILNPLWYAGAFTLGLVAGRISDAVSLGFVVETEKQVAEHLQSHLDKLPADDEASRAIVAQMKVDEERHAHEAQMAGAVELPPPAKALMRLAAKVMTRTAHYI